VRGRHTDQETEREDGVTPTLRGERARQVAWPGTVSGQVRQIPLPRSVPVVLGADNPGRSPSLGEEYGGEGRGEL